MPIPIAIAMATRPPESGEQPAQRGLVYRVTTTIDNAMRKLFFRVGYIVAGRPLLTMLLSVVFTLLSLAGMLRFRSESRAQELWVPQGTVAIDNFEYTRERFGIDARFSSIAIVGKNLGINMATKAAMLDGVRVAEAGAKVVAPFNGSQLTFARNCIKQRDTMGRRLCVTNSPFNLFYDVESAVPITGGDVDVDFFATVRKNLEMLSDGEVRQKLENGPFITPSGTNFSLGELLGGVSGSGSSYTVKAIRFVQFTENNAVDINGELVDEASDELERVWNEKLFADGATFGTTMIRWEVSSTYSEVEALRGALSGDLPLLSIGFILLTIYVMLFLGDFHVVRSRWLLGLFGLLNAGLALGVTFGLSSAFGMFFGPVHQILPLLIIGIGVDDVFVVTRALDDINANEKLKGKSSRSRIALTLSNAGSAITVTSVTNTIVFLLGAISRLPALRFFALWAAIGVVFDWFFTLTFYTAALTLDTRRQAAKRRECFPCFKIADDRDPTTEKNWFRRPPGAFTRFFQNYYGPFVTGRVMRSILILLFVALFGVSVWGCTQLYLKFDFSFFYPAGSGQRQYQNIIEEYFTIGSQSAMYLTEIDISTPENQRKYWKLCDPEKGVIATNEYIQKDSVDCWFSIFRDIEGLNSNGVVEPSTFYKQLKAFLDTPVGFKYKNDFFFKDELLDTVRFSAQKSYTPTNAIAIKALTSIREAADSVGFGKDAAGNPRAFTFDFEDLFTEQYRALPKEIGLSLALAGLAVAVICFQLVGHPLVAVVCVAVVGMVIVDILGFTYFSGVNINSVSVITIVIATGISVDYVVHCARSFLEQVGSRRERAIKALGALGPPVFYAGFSTFLAIIMLAFATSYIFNVIFLGFLALIIVGLLHGLVFAPILLSIMGPPSLFATEEEKEETEMALIESITVKEDTEEKLSKPESSEV